MKTSNLGYFTLSYFASSASAAIAFAACGASQPPIGAPGATPQSRAIAQHTARGNSWMLPEAKVSWVGAVVGKRAP